ncbi:hypothetical protein [Glaciecola sp. 1036]|uniref:hypothetical protein n=1 Tax=Alteromonadaceae TaxID=72275 RepID=UPI003D012D0C
MKQTLALSRLPIAFLAAIIIGVLTSLALDYSLPTDSSFVSIAKGLITGLLVGISMIMILKKKAV